MPEETALKANNEHLQNGSVHVNEESEVDKI